MGGVWEVALGLVWDFKLWELVWDSVWDRFGKHPFLGRFWDAFGMRSPKSYGTWTFLGKFLGATGMPLGSVWDLLLSTSAHEGSPPPHMLPKEEP